MPDPVSISVPAGVTLPISGSVTAVGGATEATLTSLNGKVTAVNTGVLALEAGGNLAALAGKDFATQTTLASVLAKLDAATSTLLKAADTLAGVTTVGSVTSITNPVGLAAGTAAIGKLAANSGVDIGDVDVTSLPAITGTVTANAGTNLNTSALATQATLATLLKPADTLAGVTTVAAVTSITNSVAVTGPVTDAQLRATAVPISGSVTATDGGSGKTLKSAVLSLAATGTVLNAVGGKRLKVYAIKLVCTAALSVNFRDGGATALEGVQAIALNGGYIEAVNPPSFLFGTTAGNSLDLVIAGVGTAAGRVSYWDDDAA